MKKMFSLALALIMALALCVPAMAADIVVENPDEDEVYKAYKVFSYTNAGDNYAYFIDTDEAFHDDLVQWIKDYTQDVTQGEPAVTTAEAVFDVDVSKSDSTHYIVNVKTGKTLDPVAFAAYMNRKVIANAATIDVDKVETAVAGTFSDLSLGYYFVDTSLGSLCSLVNTDQSQYLYEKNPAPTVVKQVQEDGNGNPSWGAYNHDDIGATVEFKSTITIPANANNASELSGVEKLVLHDVMASILDWNDTVAITVDEVALDASKYTVAAGTDDCTFEVVFDQDYLDTLNNEQHVIVVTYDAVLTTAAAADTAYENKAWVTYGQNSESTPESITKTYTYDFDLQKYTMANDAETQLAGAEFTLSKNVDGSAPIAFVELKSGEDAVVTGYRIATAAEVADENVVTTTTLVAGFVNVLGLDADTYYLTETKAPDGYNLLDKAIKVEIVEDQDGAQHIVEVDDVAVGEDDLVKVLNQTGSILPSTGGIGTTIFYTVGGVLMAAAVVLFVTKKKLAVQE